jgi:hypothetical protein
MLYSVHLTMCEIQTSDKLYHIMLYSVHLTMCEIQTSDKLYHIMLYSVHLTMCEIQTPDFCDDRAQSKSYFHFTMAMTDHIIF